MAEHLKIPLEYTYANAMHYDSPYGIANKMIDKAYEAAILHNKDVNVEADIDGTNNSIILNFYIHESGDK